MKRIIVNSAGKAVVIRSKPYDAEVEYLESTGAQYIDTGINLRQITVATYEVAFSHVPTTGNHVIYGIFWDGSDTNRNQGPYVGTGAWKNYSPAYNYPYTTSTISPASSGPVANTKYTIVSTQRNTYASDYTMYFFARNNDGGSYLPAENLRCYSLQIQISDTKVRDFIPVRVGNVGYMYDKVSGQLFGNIGTGSFIVGPDVKIEGNAAYLEDGGLPSEYRRLTGINFDGNVWYETDYYLKGSDTLRFAFKATKACNVLGCYTASDAQDNYSLYCSTTSGAKYLRYNGGTYNSYIAANTRYDVVITPTGSDGMRTDSSWTAQTFTAPSKMCIGTTSTGATSAKLTGVLYGNVSIDNGPQYIPVERISDGEIGYYELNSEIFYENLGSGTPTALGYTD